MKDFAAFITGTLGVIARNRFRNLRCERFVNSIVGWGWRAFHNERRTLPYGPGSENTYGTTLNAAML
jgi:hypothetical protein